MAMGAASDILSHVFYNTIDHNEEVITTTSMLSTLTPTCLVTHKVRGKMAKAPEGDTKRTGDARGCWGLEDHPAVLGGGGSSGSSERQLG